MNKYINGITVKIGFSFKKMHTHFIPKTHFVFICVCNAMHTYVHIDQAA